MYKNIFISQRSNNNPAQVFIWGDGAHDDAGLTVYDWKDFDYCYIPSANGTHQSIYGHSVKKTKFWDRYGGSQTTFESDVPRETRVLTDLYLDHDEMATGHTIGFFDIEVSSIGGYPNTLTADKEVTAIAFYHQQQNQYTMFLLDPDEKMEDRIKDNIDIRRFTTEKELLEKFLDWFEVQEFSILTGWNSSGGNHAFDIPYLVRRLDKILGADEMSRLSPIGVVRWSEYKQEFEIAGISLLDYLQMYRKFQASDRPNYRLDTIGKLEVGFGKTTYEGSLDSLFATDLEKFIEYNLNDVKIIVELDKKLRYIELAMGICHTGRVSYGNFMTPAKYIEGAILVYLHRKNIIAPNKPVGGHEELKLKTDNDEVGFDGAYVKFPYPGLYRWVYSLDLQSLYPSVIRGLNISIETKIGFITDWDVQKHIQNSIIKYNVVVQNDRMELNKEELDNLMSELNLTISANGILYSNDKRGVIPEVLDVWFDTRKKYQALKKKYEEENNKELAQHYDKLQYIQKIVLNSVYGTSGLSTFRFYDLDNAAAVTSTGQEVIKASSKYVNKKFYKNMPEHDMEWLARYNVVLKKNKIVDFTPDVTDHCVYIDTDSLYFSYDAFLDSNDSDTIKLKKTVEFAKQVEKDLNAFYDVMAQKFFYNVNHKFVIKGEAIAKTALWIVKKRYALLKTYDLEKNKKIEPMEVTTKGLDVVRSTFAPAFAGFMKPLLLNILEEMPKTEIGEKILSFKNKISSISIDQIARNSAVKEISKFEDPMETSFVKFPKKTPMHVKSAILYNRLLKTLQLDGKYPAIRNGDKIKYMYLKKNPYDIETLAFKGFEDAPEIMELIEEYADPVRQCEAELETKLQKFYDALDWGILPTKVNQNASKFFKIKA